MKFHKFLSHKGNNYSFAMCSFYFSLAVALAIAFTSFGSARAAPAFANTTSCQTDSECKDGEYCDEKTGFSSCIPCLDCEALNRIPGDGCVKTVSDCEDCLGDFVEIENECRNDTTEGPPPAGAEVPTDGKSGEKHVPPGEKSGTPVNYVWIILLAIAVLAAIVVSVVCTGRGRLPWKRPRIGEDDNRGVPEEIELDHAEADGDAEFYESNVREPVRNQNDDPGILEQLIGAELRNEYQAEAPVPAQQPRVPNGLGDEVSMPLLANGAPALLPNDIRPEMENAIEMAVGNNVNEPPAPEQAQVDQNVIRELPDFVQLRGNNNEDRAGNVNISGGDSGIGDDDGYDPVEHEVPHSPSSPDSQLPDESAADNSITSVSNNSPEMLEIGNLVNHEEPKVAIRGRKRSAGATVGENQIGL